MSQDSPSRRQDQFVLRLPDGMRERIAEASKTNNRSMNAEIVSTLLLHYPPPPSASELLARIKTTQAMMQEFTDSKFLSDAEMILTELNIMLRDARRRETSGK